MPEWIDVSVAPPVADAVAGTLLPPGVRTREGALVQFQKRKADVLPGKGTLWVPDHFRHVFDPIQVTVT